MQHWTDPLEEGPVKEMLLSREAYRRTEFIVLRGDGGATALVGVDCASREALFNPITAVEWLAGPGDCAYAVRPDVDTANATALAEVALSGRRSASGLRCRRPVSACELHRPGVFPRGAAHRRGARPGRHGCSIWPTRPIAIDEDLPPVRLVPELLDVRTLAAAMPDNPRGSGVSPEKHWLLPCQGAGLDLPGTVDYLDQRPARADWTLVGCERSRQLHRWFYGDEPDRQVELCPDRLIPAGDGAATLLRCCLLERGLRVEGNRAVVPWGTNLGEVQTALRALTGIV